MLKTLFIAENRIGTVDVFGENGTIFDDYRIDYLNQHIIYSDISLIDYIVGICYLVLA